MANEATETFGILVEALSNLQDVSDGDIGVSLPKVITVGNQSAGKSSVIEMMVGKQFLPRGKGIKTRCPIHVRMHQKSELAATEEYAILRSDSSVSDDMTLKDFDEVCKEIERRTDRRTDGKNISKEPILLDIYSPNYPDLQFVDLPGFTKIALDRQDSDIEQQVLDLNLPIMKEPNTIILAIQDATQDIASSEALKRALANDVDPNGDRTIGVLTKLDNLHSGSDRRSVAEILQNKSKPLKLGYIGIVNRTQDEIDNKANAEVSKENEKRTVDQHEFQILKGSIGIDVLRQRIIKILAEQVKKLIPSLKQRSEDKLKQIRSELEHHGLNKDDDVDPDDQIAMLVEMAIGKIRINLEGMNVRVATEELNTGHDLNELIKKGTNKASKTARKEESVKKFHRRLIENLKKNKGIRDNIFPDQLVLEIGVGILTENYRKPFKNLLQETTEMLTKNMIRALETTLGAFPYFKDVVQDILLADLEVNKTKAEEFVDMLVDIHKRFINSEHHKFAKVSQGIRSGDKGIRYKNLFDVWFKDEDEGPSQKVTEGDSLHSQEWAQDVSNRDSTSSDEDEDEDKDKDKDKDEDEDEDEPAEADIGALAGQAVGSAVGVLHPVLAPIAAGATTVTVNAVKGFAELLQTSDVEGVHTNKLPSGMSDEAKLHIDLCLQYMEIVDDALVDAVPKIFIMMLVMKTIDFLNGVDERGLPYRSSLLRTVQKKTKEEETKKKMVMRSQAHEKMINDLKTRKAVCEETIRVIDETNSKLNECT